MHSSLIGKVEKAKPLRSRAGQDLGPTARGHVPKATTTPIRPDSTAKPGTATCHFFDSFGSCVHVLALQKILGVMLPETAQVSIFASPPAVPA